MTGALENLTVLDLTRVVSGPYCGAILGDLGARVIKIERPELGDDSRQYAPHINGESTYYANLNRNKAGVTLNLKHPVGRQMLLDLVKQADILIENYRPGVMDRLGLGYDVLSQVNDQLIYGTITGFGQYGPYADRPGYDIVAQAMGGLMSLTGQKGGPPTRSGNAMGDILGGMNLAIGLLAAVNARRLTGHGQRVDIALVDSVVASLENAFARYFESGQVPPRTGNSYASIAPYDTFQATDGHVVVACGNQRLFEVLCQELIGHPELIADPRFTTIPLRVLNNEALKVYIEEWTGQLTVEQVVEQALGKGVPAAPIYDLGQIVHDPHIAGHRQMFVPVDHPVIGRMTVNGNPIKLEETPPVIEQPAPTLGQHNAAVYGELLGLDATRLEELAAEGVI
ncbi:MAG: CoA transferase [Bifidobacteriaceae bacterium]|nr:CoA transferase [Bifidobacteriaceae bacterium]